MRADFVSGFSRYPICDTNIWVNICLGDIISELFYLHRNIIIADVVEGEIMRWSSNTNFNKIATRFTDLKAKGAIRVVDYEVDIDEGDRPILEKILTELGFENGFKNRPPEKDMGEGVSAIYADYFEIELLKSEDGFFREGGRGKARFPNLNVKDWNQTLRDIFQDDHKKRIFITQKVIDERERMDYHKQKYEQSKEEREKELMDKKLKEFKEKFCRRH